MTRRCCIISQLCLHHGLAPLRSTGHKKDIILAWQVFSHQPVCILVAIAPSPACNQATSTLQMLLHLSSVKSGVNTEDSNPNQMVEIFYLLLSKHETANDN